MGIEFQDNPGGLVSLQSVAVKCSAWKGACSKKLWMNGGEAKGHLEVHEISEAQRTPGQLPNWD